MTILQPLSKNCYVIPKQDKMHVEARVYLSRKMARSFHEKETLTQLMDAASLPGVYKYVLGMPDIHRGFGLPIGGVMAMDAEDGVVSSGAVGMDINCGVRLLKTNIPAAEIDKPLLRKIMQAIVARVPTGIGKQSRHAKNIGDILNTVVTDGVPALLKMGIGRREDIESVEEQGKFPGADLKAVSKKAISRSNQLSTIGGGNHFIEIGYVAEIFDRDFSGKMGLHEGYLTVLIHTGSRGFGHQICTDYSDSMKKDAARMKIPLPNAGLASVPIKSPQGKKYLAAMACAVNFAFCNRQWITHDVREAFADILGGKDTDYDLGIVYDVAHNIAKFETIDGKKLLIHRKGATRALPPGHPLNPPGFLSTGHPAIIPGSMGTSSYIVTGTKKVSATFNSVNHGAGRLLSRSAAKKEICVKELEQKMKDILIMGRDFRVFLDEAPQAYKDIDSVIDTLAEIGITHKVARLFPLAVIKGEGF